MSMPKIAISALLIVFVFSCKNKKNPDNIYKYRNYINYTTTGIISTSDALELYFTKSIERWKGEDHIPQDILSVYPEVAGNLVLKNSNVLRFLPSSPLKPDTEYTVTIQMDKVFEEVPKDKKTYTFQCKTIKPGIAISVNNLQSYSKDWQFVEGTLESADIIKLEAAKKLVKASQRKKNINIVWDNSDPEGRFFNFKLDSIQRFENDDALLIAWNGKGIKSDVSGEDTIVVPGKNNFRVTRVNVFREGQQYITVNFSDPLKKDQNFNGLVTVKNISNPKFEVNGNLLKVYFGEQVTGNTVIEVFRGIENTGGYKLKEQFSTSLVFEELKPAVKLVNSGNFLPDSDNLKFNFEAVNLRAVDVRIIKIYQDNVLQFLQNNNLNSKNEVRRVGRRVAKKTIQLIKNTSEHTKNWKAYSIDLSKLFKADAGSIYRVELSFRKEYSLYGCEEGAEMKPIEELTEVYHGEEEKEEQYWNNKLYRYRNYYYNWQQRDNPCHKAYYNNAYISQNLIASNLGVIVKRGHTNNYFFAVADILTAQPVSGAKISLYNYQQQKFHQLTTNEGGIARYDSDKEAYFAVVTKSGNTTYIKLNDGNSLSLSKFDVSGAKTQKGMKGYIYAERGVWRPGDSIHLNFVLDDSNNKLPKEHPVKIEVINPNGKLVYKKVITKHVNRFYAFPFATSVESITGMYRAKVSVGGAQFTKNLHVEAVKPNRLKIHLDFDKEIFSHDKPINGNLQLNWLHGAPAGNIRAQIKAKIVHTSTVFDGYKKYVFHDPTREYRTEEVTLFDGKVNDAGLAKIKNKLSVGKNAPGMLRIHFLAKAFETGGDFSIDAFSKKFAPYSSFVGLQSPKEDTYGSYNTKTNYRFDVISLSDQGKPIARKNVKIKLYKLEWRWWWNSGRDNLSSYHSDAYHKAYKSLQIDTDHQGKAHITISIPKSDRGRYLIRVIDPVSGHATGRVMYFYDNWWENTPSDTKEAAKMLVFTSDKKSYQVGETAKITLPSAHIGKALISLENGNEVIKHLWADTKKGKTVVEIPITANMIPNFFVNISLLQPHSRVENDLPIRLYGTIPIKVEDISKKLMPEISMPDTIEPEKEFTVTISEKNQKPMTYTLAIVEEGLLDLTRFKTPNPYESFYKREALGVRTWDIYDDVLGAYSGSIDQVFAIGGDGTSEVSKNRKANRFKPVVKHLGPFVLKPGGENKHTLQLSNYIGSVRAMIVAGNTDDEAYGNTDKTVKVKKPLMALASLPRKLSPGEKVTLPVTVFANEDHIKNVSVSIQTSGGIKVTGKKEASVAFSKTGEQMAYFNLDISKAKGVQTILVKAKSGANTAKYHVEVDVINPNPVTSRVLNKVIQAHQEVTLDFSTFGTTGSNSGRLQFSSIPPIDFEKRLEYLIQYPHGCLEQTTSGVFPQLYMTDLFDLSTVKRNHIENHIKEGIKRLGEFQRPNGGMSYWPGEISSNDWGTTYAGHFMLEAERRGYVLPFSFKKNWIRYQKEAARKWRVAPDGYSGDMNQAYRLYTLALSGNPDLGAMNRLREYKDLSNEAKWRLAAAYALIGQGRASEELTNTAGIEFNDRDTQYTYGSVTRNKAMALETMLLLDDPKTFELAKSIAKDLSGNQWMSTQTTAYSLLVMGKMMIKNGGKSIKARYHFEGEKTTLETSKSIIERSLNIHTGDYQLKLKNMGSNTIYVSIITKGKLPLGGDLAVSRGLSSDVQYSLPDGTPVTISKLKQGREFKATVTVTNLNNEKVSDIALSQFFPSGWEIINTRFAAYNGGTDSKARYTDIRDDRVNFYFDLSRKGTKNSSKTFSVLLNASYLGTYYVPGLQVEAMYDHDYLTRSKGKWVTVIK
ncbi:MAG: hypothetical protein GKR88_01340 [Flavobacteriaceae bacterium]|nr:MAG: hypothetical protein GKR88_01340 [Flavobacteriaceae bacterium]